MTLGQRLRKAIDERMGERRIREFQRKMRELEVPGSSYPSIHRYLNDGGTPCIEFVRQAAESLDVRFEWLLFGQGEMTKAAEQTELTRRMVIPRPQGEGSGGADPNSSPSENPGSELEMWSNLSRFTMEVISPEWDDLVGVDPVLQAVILETIHRIGALGGDEIAQADAESADAFPDDLPESWKPRYHVALALGHLLSGPLSSLPFRKLRLGSTLSSAEFRDYVIESCQAILRLAGARTRAAQKRRGAP